MRNPMGEGKVDHLGEARNYLAGLKLCSPSPAERQQFADAAQAHALIALVEEAQADRQQRREHDAVLRDICTQIAGLREDIRGPGRKR